ncbi:MAG: D-glycero-alpha-D-manno-heptose-1,7-bisphosphate 7-phosphatase [Planctomycetota bacterium]|jgi:D,D-heptose 1,7-bisphosphate phosphatase
MADIAVFLDRDDTLIKDTGYISDPDQVKLLDWVAEGLVELRQMGYKLIAISNQSAVARGIITEKTLGDIHDRLNNLLAEKGAQLDRIYYCPYHPDGVVEKYRRNSKSRKPNPGMLLKAAKEMDIDLSRCWTIGNSSCDIEAGKKAGTKTIIIDNPAHTKPELENNITADYKAINMKEAVNIIKKYHRTSARQISASDSKSKTNKNIYQPDITDMETQTPETTQTSTEQTEQLLEKILEQLKRNQRDYLFEEFSLMRLLAGVIQGLVLFCLLISICFLMSPGKNNNSIFIAIAFAAVLQIMALTFYTMQTKK